MKQKNNRIRKLRRKKREGKETKERRIDCYVLAS